MLPDRVSNPGPLTYESGTLPIALRGLARERERERERETETERMIGGRKISKQRSLHLLQAY